MVIQTRSPRQQQINDVFLLRAEARLEMFEEQGLQDSQKVVMASEGEKNVVEKSYNCRRLARGPGFRRNPPLAEKVRTTNATARKVIFGMYRPLYSNTSGLVWLVLVTSLHKAPHREIK